MCIRDSIYTARPGIIIGRKGAEIDKLKQEVQKRTKRSQITSQLRYGLFGYTYSIAKLFP